MSTNTSSSPEPFGFLSPLIDAAFDLAGMVAKTAWEARVELAPAVIVGGTYYGFARLIGYVWAGFATAGLIGTVVWPRRVRSRLIRAFRSAQFRRTWIEAQKAVGFPTIRGVARVPLPARKLRLEPGMVHFTVRVHGGLTYMDIEDAAPALAAELHALRLRVSPDEMNFGKANLTLMRTDPLVMPSGLPTRLMSGYRTSMGGPIAIGRLEDGSVATISLVEHNLLVGGEPGGGKSVALNLICAHAALDPNVKLALFDAKRVELSVWRHSATDFVTTSMEKAVSVLKEIVSVMEDRYEILETHEIRKVDHRLTGLVVVVIDELAMYLNHPNKKLADTFAHLLRDLVARGRAAGVIVVAATQKPAADTVPTSIRDLFSYRLAFRCTTREASDTILGSGWASRGYSATDIASKDRGIGLLLAEGSEPLRLRTAFLSDENARVIAQRANLRRKSMTSYLV